MTLPALSAILLKTERAEKHIGDLETVVRAFRDSGPYESVPEKHGEGRQVYRARVIHQLSPRWGLIVGDAVHNLRSALDHLAVALVKASGGEPDDDTAFPFTKKAESFEANLLRKVPGASQAAIDKLRALELYPSGHKALWGLHRLDIIDKHRVPILVGSAAQIERIQVVSVGDFDPGPLARFLPDPIYPVEEGIILHELVIPPGSKVCVDPEFSYDVAFGKGEVFEGQPIVPTLQELAQLVVGIIYDFGPLLERRVE